MQKISQISSVIVVYGVTLLALWQGLKPFFPALDLSARPVAASPYVQQPAKKPDTAIAKKLSGTPASLVIPAINFDREVVPGIYDEQKKSWHIYPRDIHFATTSQPANNHSGSTLIYAHNNRYAFGSLKKLQTGDEAKLMTDNGYLFTYQLEHTSDHHPLDTSIFAYSGEPLLTLMTCSGAFNEIRMFYTFKLLDVEKL